MCFQKEVIAALPKLIKLNPVVVKEVFNRLLGGHGRDFFGHLRKSSHNCCFVKQYIEFEK